jgi:hypothetical protein
MRYNEIKRPNMKKNLWIITLSLLMVMSCALYTAGPGTGYPGDIGDQQEYGADMDDMDFNYMYNYLAS